MRKGGQKRKAYSHEKQIGKYFEKAYYPGGEGTFLRRDSLLGIRDKKLAPGDLVAVRYLCEKKDSWVLDKDFPFSIECKHWRGENLGHFFRGLYASECEIWNWVSQAKSDAKASDRIPIVVFRLFRTKDVAILLWEDFQKLLEIFGDGLILRW